MAFPSAAGLGSSFAIASGHRMGRVLAVVVVAVVRRPSSGEETGLPYAETGLVGAATGTDRGAATDSAEENGQSEASEMEEVIEQHSLNAVGVGVRY